MKPLILIMLLGMLTGGCDVINLMRDDEGCKAYATGLLQSCHITQNEADIISGIYERYTRPSKRLGQ